MGGACGMWHVRRRGDVNTGFGGETEGKTPPGRLTRRWEDNIRMDLK